MIKKTLNEMISEIDHAEMIFLGNSYSMYDRFVDFFKFSFKKVTELLKEENKDNSNSLKKIKDSNELFTDLLKAGSFNKNAVNLIKSNLIEVRDTL